MIFAELPFKVSNSITKVLFSDISSRVEYSPDLTAKTLRIVLLISFFLVSIIYFFGNWLVIVLYGKSFQEVYNVLLFLLPGSFFFNITQILNSDLSGRGYPSYGMRSGLFVLILSSMMNILLIPIYGLKGVALVSSLTYILGALFMVFYFLKTTTMSFQELFQIRKTDFNFRVVDYEK